MLQVIKGFANLTHYVIVYNLFGSLICNKATFCEAIMLNM